MKTDLATSIGAAIAGVLISYFVVNIFFGEIEDFTIKSVDPNLTVELAEPNENIFNFRALNPTVEVYVGECDEYNEDGECIDVAEAEREGEESQEETPVEDQENF
ncbi:hypothetical protein IJJ49_02240 [Candidatus Saccharibacteria bacterium]|nr:hypothetical protein [Candidatus Saccharibacteria bacterium]